MRSRGLSDGTVCITATAFSRLSSYCMVTVGQGVSTERNFGECGNLGEIFTTEDGLWWRVSGPDTVVLLPENNKTQNYSGSYSSMAEIVVPAAVSYAGKTYRVTAIAAEASTSTPRPPPSPCPRAWRPLAMRRSSLQAA